MNGELTLTLVSLPVFTSHFTAAAHCHTARTPSVQTLLAMNGVCCA